jgi:hypothetical protein
MDTRAYVTVKGADMAALLAEAHLTLDALVGDQHVAKIDSIETHVDSRMEPGGIIIAWRADVIATIDRRPPDQDRDDEEPF